MEIPEDIQYILDTLENNNYPAYLVGGCVRDYLIGKEISDYDICTSATPDETARIFAHTVPTGLLHGTITVMSGNHHAEVTTFRKESSYSDGRHPDSVAFSQSVEEDLARRDFTINALAWRQGVIIDLFGGIHDIRDKTIRAVGDPGLRFQEDALRMLRCIRLLCRLQFSAIEETTFTAIKENKARLQLISWERIRDEMLKILLSAQPARGMRLLSDVGLLEYILPEIVPCIGFQQHSLYHDKDVFEHTLSVLENTPPDKDLRLAAILHDLGKPNTFTRDENGRGHFYGHAEIGAVIAANVMHRWRLDKKTIKKVTSIIATHMYMKKWQTVTDKNIRKLLAKIGKEYIWPLFQLARADIAGGKEKTGIKILEEAENTTRRLLEENTPLTVKDLAINGLDLIEIGFRQGRELGETLSNLLLMVLEDSTINTRSLLLEEAKTAKENANKKPACR